ncbi:MAG: cyclophane-forming radical SAM/SPASM peptide maturase YhhB [Pseudohongiella sp.]|nr:cyclophane-forming radical SAM/SPASM peptide maturase YhhB [Pseudohongiella sp.]
MLIHTVLLKVASRCNINCSYCYVYNMGDEGWRDMPHLITSDKSELLFFRLEELSNEQSPPFAVVLHGGEPLMMGARRLEHLFRGLRESLSDKYPISMQTNGMLLNSQILDLCSDYRISISVSLDGPQHVNDKFRVDHKELGTFDRVVAGIQLLSNHPDANFLFAGTLSVIEPNSDPREIYAFLKDLRSPSLDFLYRDGNHTNLPYGKQDFNSTEYGDWLSALLNIYCADPSPPRIRFLDDLVRLALGQTGIKEGLGDNNYGILIIETDGSITKNDTLKSAFNGADKFDNKWHLKSDALSSVISSDEFKNYHSMQRPSSTICNQCSFLPICGGGMPLHRWKAGTNFDNPSVYCNDQKKIISAVVAKLQESGLAN